jgi:hypothetical protein
MSRKVDECKPLRRGRQTEYQTTEQSAYRQCDLYGLYRRGAEAPACSGLFQPRATRTYGRILTD